MSDCIQFGYDMQECASVALDVFLRHWCVIVKVEAVIRCATDAPYLSALSMHFTYN
jgi:hypothetical protein